MWYFFFERVEKDLGILVNVEIFYYISIFPNYIFRRAVSWCAYGKNFDRVTPNSIENHCSRCFAKCSK